MTESDQRAYHASLFYYETELKASRSRVAELTHAVRFLLAQFGVSGLPLDDSYQGVTRREYSVRALRGVLDDHPARPNITYVVKAPGECPHCDALRAVPSEETSQP